MTDYIRKRVESFYVGGQIKIIGEHHIWKGKWKAGQAEAKFNGKRQSILPYIYYTHYGMMPPEAGAVMRTCPEPLCVNPAHLVSRARNMTQVRSTHTRSKRGNYAKTISNYAHTVTDDRIENRRYKITRLAAEAENV